MIISSNRVLRGGSWINNGRNVRSAYRNMNEPGKRNDNIGFRLALAHMDVDTLFDQIIILTISRYCNGKKPMPFGMLVGQAGALVPDACRSGDSNRNKP